jgi:hypothetical protein
VVKTQFALDLQRFADQIEYDAGALARKLALIGMRTAIRLSPVDTGRFRNGSQLGIGRKPESEGGGGEAGVLRLVALAGPQREDLWIINNVPYGPQLEAGHSRQAPGGVLGPTLVELESIVQREWRTLRG